MSLTLAIETSSPVYGVIVSTPDGPIEHRTVERAAASFHSIGHLVAECVHHAGIDFGDIDRIAVDCGPGRLNSVRAGVAYANGLAFSLQRGVFAANSLDIMAQQAFMTAPGIPALCLRKSYAGTVNAGLFRQGHAPVLRHGPLATTVLALAADAAEITVSGEHRATVVSILAGVRVTDTGVEFPDVLALDRLVAGKGVDAVLGSYATPVTDLTSSVPF